ncbi:hypothetical protein BJ508DRAFT_305992 [Ascobolus immersus RN42]|uniref:Uncharacterized protein n=1 Tax=Ascobolus immersus RN42 TaxID=1160509 RepID=A0A3N4I9F3_ASCIM|nr:hypothetical protein BJ508DRAFT_305992 [Ascobolus immersus RN42]
MRPLTELILPALVLFSYGSSTVQATGGSRNGGCPDVIILHTGSKPDLVRSVATYIRSELEGGHNFGSYIAMKRFIQENPQSVVEQKRKLYEEKMANKTSTSSVDNSEGKLHNGGEGQHSAQAPETTIEVPVPVVPEPKEIPTFWGLLVDHFTLSRQLRQPPQPKQPKQPEIVVKKEYQATVGSEVTEWKFPWNSVSQLRYLEESEFADSMQKLRMDFRRPMDECPDSRLVAIGAGDEVLVLRWFLLGTHPESRAWNQPPVQDMSDWPPRATFGSTLAAVAFIDDPSHTAADHEGMDSRLRDIDTVSRFGFAYRETMRSWSAKDGHVCNGAYQEQPHAERMDLDEMNNDGHVQVVGSWILERLKSFGIMPGPLPGLVHLYESL